MEPFGNMQSEENDKVVLLYKLYYKQMLYAAYDDVLKEFKKTSDYQELPETKEDAEKKKQTKKVSSAEPADETDDIQEDWKNAFLSESTGVSVGTTHTDNHLRPATNPAV